MKPPFMYFSPSKLSFYAPQLISAYKAAGTLPNDIVPISKSVWLTYAAQPADGHCLSAADGQPAWNVAP